MRQQPDTCAIGATVVCSAAPAPYVQRLFARAAPGFPRSDLCFLGWIDRGSQEAIFASWGGLTGVPKKRSLLLGVVAWSWRNHQFIRSPSGRRSCSALFSCFCEKHGETQTGSDPCKCQTFPATPDRRGFYRSDRALEAAEKLCFVSGHDFSHAVKPIKSIRCFSPCGMLFGFSPEPPSYSSVSLYYSRRWKISEGVGAFRLLNVCEFEGPSGPGSCRISRTPTKYNCNIYPLRESFSILTRPFAKCTTIVP
jgi:hypothetical protein